VRPKEAPKAKMILLPQREIASAILIDIGGRFLLQQRDDIAGILQSGKVGLFGGHREGNETFLQCVVREIQEETSYFVSPDRFEHLISYDGVDLDAENGTVHGEFFITRHVPVAELAVTEGSLLIVGPNQLANLAHKFAPSAQFAIQTLLNKQVA
jgi:8-oxo-dGTP pyrophosphatase MutT (NUDIX family)